MKINVIAVGKIKEKFYTDAIKEYQKRLSKFVSLNIIEVNEFKNSNTTDEQILITKEKEGKNLLSKIKGYTIVLAIDGKQFDSVEFSEYVENLKLNGVSEISFVIGGSHGLSDEVLKKADLKISFGKFTYPHQLMRVILMEQIYRINTIKQGTPYHK